MLYTIAVRMDFVLPLLVTLPQAATGMIAGALGFSIIVTAIFFIVAYFFQSPQLTAVAHDEFAALIFTAIIIFVWITGDGFFNGIISGLIGIAIPGGPQVSGLSVTHVELALQANAVFKSKLLSLYTNLYLYEILIGFLSTISFPIGAIFSGPAIVSFSFMPYISLGMLSNIHTSVVESIGLLIAAVWVKEFLLFFCEYVVPLILLPIGIFLRAFPFSRTTGSSIIALCFAAYFVYPFSVLFSYYTVFDLYHPSEPPPMLSSFSLFKTSIDQSTGEHAITEMRNESKTREELFRSEPLAEQAASGDLYCSGHEILCSFERLWKGAYRLTKEFITTAISIWKFMMGFTGDFYSGLAGPFLPSNTAAGLYYFIVREVSHVGQFIVLMMITSIIEIIITITMYRNIAWVIGGEMELAGITKLV